MTTDDTRALLQTLLARKGNSPEFGLEIEGYIDDLENDELDAADRKYIGDVAKRLGVSAGAATENRSAPTVPAAVAGNSNFERAKAAFADMFDPDQLDPDAPDAALRREIFEEFSAELKRIEDEGD